MRLICAPPTLRPSDHLAAPYQLIQCSPAKFSFSTYCPLNCDPNGCRSRLTHSVCSASVVNTSMERDVSLLDWSQADCTVCSNNVHRPASQPRQGHSKRREHRCCPRRVSQVSPIGSITDARSTTSTCSTQSPLSAPHSTRTAYTATDPQRDRHFSNVLHATDSQLSSTSLRSPLHLTSFVPLSPKSPLCQSCLSL